MKSKVNFKKKSTVFIAILLVLVFGQALVIGKIYREKDDKTYEVNLVQIKTEKDSIDFLKMKNDMSEIDQTVHELNTFLKDKSVSNQKIENLDKDSLTSSIYLAKQANRYSDYLMNLQKKVARSSSRNAR